MITEQIIAPKSIAIIGGSNDIKKPGGKIVKNCLEGGYKGKLYIINPKEKEVQGITCFPKIEDLPNTDLAIIVIPANHCLEAVTTLANEKNTKGFIIISAGFGETNNEGKEIEEKIVSAINKVNGCLIGPNCIGLINAHYKGVFTTPIPKFHEKGCDLISSSGATAVFIMEAGIPLGVKFSNVFSVGNAAQTGVEEVLEYMDNNFDPQKDPPIKLLYLETIKNPSKLFKHAASLINKGAKIAAIKAGSTLEGSRAATSHTGAIASSDMTVRALFKKAGIVYCSSREELLTTASIFNYKKLKGKNIAIITHAGGSAVMLTDVLSKGGLKIPLISGPNTEKLKSFLHPGSSVNNPIDFLATGTAEQLGIIIDYCEHKFDEIDAMAVVFGSPGLFDVENVYNVLSVKLDICSKPIFPVLPSLLNARKEIQGFLGKGNINFPDEVVLGKALTQVYKTPAPSPTKTDLPKVNFKRIRELIDTSINGYLEPEKAGLLLDAVGIPRAKEINLKSEDDLKNEFKSISFPIAMKIQGPLHKSDVQGVILDISTVEEAIFAFKKLMRIKGATSILLQPMIKGIELFVGVVKEPGFNHTILCGLGGIFIEVLNDVSAGISPISKKEATEMVNSLRGYPILKGTRGKEGISINRFVEVIQRLSALVEIAPEIVELDINPLIGNKKEITSVDVRIKIDRTLYA